MYLAQAALACDVKIVSTVLAGTIAMVLCALCELELRLPLSCVSP